MSTIDSQSPTGGDALSGLNSLFVRALLLVGSGMKGLYTLALVVLVVLLLG